jgi:hypothetical protein
MQAQYDSEVILPRFRRLMQDVTRGRWQRNSFESWEIELLLDIEACGPIIAARRDLLPRYQKAVERQLGKRGQLPMKLSEYVESLRARQLSRLGTRVENRRPVMEPALS